MLQALATANAGNFAMIARHFVKRWEKAIGADVVVEEFTESSVYFRMSLSGLYMRGFEDPRALVLAASQTQTRTSLLEALRPFSAGDPPLLLCPSESQFAEVKALMPRNRAAVLSPHAIKRVLAGGSEAFDALRTSIREQLPLLRLQPYDTTRPVFGEMFTGRRHELNLLVELERDSFLITGPTRIGKTSLIQHYQWLMRREGNPRSSRSFYLNLQSCENESEDEVARRFAVHFRDVPYTANNLTMRELRSFLYSVLARAGGPVDITLDEADAVCHTNLLVTTAEFAAASRSRLIVIGRGRVRRYLRKHHATAFGRLRDLRFQALNAAEAWTLFRHPLECLGLRIESPEETRKLLLRLSSRMPHLVQSCARFVVEQAAEQGTQIVTVHMLRRSQDSFLDYGILRTHFDDLQSDRARLAAIAVLTRLKEPAITLERIQQALDEQGIAVSANETADLCDDLVTNCLLTWEKMDYAPPRWDIYEAARQHHSFLIALQRECLVNLRRSNV